MEFIRANLINTTTQIAVQSNTALASNLFARDPYSQYYTEGWNNDNTSTSITITFDATTSISRIGLMDTNLKEFYFFYNGATANSITLTNSDTTTASYTGNADTNKYFRFATIACTSITLVGTKTIVANSEKLVGLLWLSDLNLALEKIPNSKSYKPKRNPKQVVHTLSDGGTRIHNVRSKWSSDLTLRYVSEAQRDGLYDIFNAGVEFGFCPFGTGTGWDGILFEAVWTGPFEFYQYADDAAVSGFEGKITLKETPA